MSNRQNIHGNIHYGLTLVLIVMLPLYMKAASLVVILLTLNWLAEGRFAVKIKRLSRIQSPLRTVFFSLISLYTLHVIALLYTDNMQDGFFELEKKLSFLAFPLIFTSYFPLNFQSQRLKHFLFAYTGSSFSASVFCVGRALMKYAESGDSSVMYYQNFTFYEHPTYFAMFMLTAMIVLTGFLVNSFAELRTKHKITLSALIVWFAIIVMLANSRAAIIAMAVVILGTGIYIMFRSKKYYIALIVLALSATGGLSVKWFMPHVYDRFAFGLDEVFSARKMNDIQHWNGTTLRLQVYYSAFELIGENLWTGVSPGDVTDELVASYKKHGFRHAAERGYNAHNQYLQTCLGLGIVGLLVLLVLLLLPFIHAWRKRNLTLILFILMTAVLFMFESMLQLQAGIMFISGGLVMISAFEPKADENLDYSVG